MNIRQLAGFAIFLIGLAAPAAHAQPPLSARAPVATPTSTNAYDYYVAARQAVDTSIHSAYQAFDYGSPTENLAPYHTALERDQAVLQVNARALELLRLGFRFPYSKPRENTPSDFMDFPDMASMRQLARLLMLQEYVESQTGDWAGAVNSGIDAIHLGVDLPHGGGLIDLLVGAAIEAIGRRGISEAVAHLSALDAANATHGLEVIENNRASFADVLAAERDHSLRMIEREAAEAAKQPDQWPKQTGGSKSPADYEKQFRIFMDALIANARLPYAAPKPKIDVPTDPMARQACNAFLATHGISLPFSDTVMGFSYERARATNRLLLVQLALQAFHAATGHYPEGLPELVPAQLAAVPADPFAVAKPLQYKKQGDSYLLYSLGPDCIDDGGRPITLPNGNHSVLPGSQGDIVAGIN